MTKELEIDGEKRPLISKANEEEHQSATPSILDDALDTLTLGIPIFISRLSFVGMKTTDTALLGHVSREALSAAALSDLWTMCTQVLISGRILGVLVGGAVGAGNPKLAGIYLQVSLAVLCPLSIFVFVAWSFTDRFWILFGSDPEVSQMAGYYATVLAFAIPGILGFGQLSQFFSAQRIMRPEVNCSSLGLILNLVLGLILVLGVGIPHFSGFGFKACPIVTMLVTYVQLAALLVVYVGIQKLHVPCWGGWDMKEITWPRIKTFSELYFPSALSSASDFWRVGAIGAVAANLGEGEVAVFNTSYRIMWIALILVGSLSGASSINMSLRLGKLDHIGARQAGYVGVAMSTCMLTLFSMFLLFQCRLFFSIFTNDELYLDMFEEANVPFTITLFFMNLSVAVERIPYSMGRTNEVFWMGLIASWGGQVPAVFLCTKYWRHDLVGLYTGMAIGYALLAVLYSYITLKSDWKLYAEIAQRRSEGAIKPTIAA